MSAKIIEFPKTISTDTAQNVIEDMKMRKAYELSMHLADSIMMAGSREIVAHGFDTQDAEFLKDFAFVLESLRSCLLRQQGLHHAIQDLIDTHCNFNVIHNNAGDITKIGLELLLNDLDDDTID